MGERAAIGGGIVVYSYDDGTQSYVTAANEATGALRWRVPWPGNRAAGSAQFVITPDAVVVSRTFDGRVSALNPATGATRWRVAVGAPDDTEGAKVAGNLVYAGGSGTIYVLRLQTGSVATYLGTGSFANSDLVLSGGWVSGAPAGCLTPPTLTAWRVS